MGKKLISLAYCALLMVWTVNAAGETIFDWDDGNLGDSL